VSAAKPGTTLPPFPRVARGQRPNFFADESSDILLSMNVALLSELMATRERLDTLERLLARKGVIAATEIDGFDETPQDEAEREKQRETTARHVFYLLLQQAERAAKGDATS
jgi:hypothetical protein